MRTKSELIEAVAKEVGLSKKQAAAAVEAVITFMRKAIVEGGLKLVGFGTFCTKMRSARKGRDIRTGAEIQIPAKRVPVFRPSKALKKLVE